MWKNAFCKQANEQAAGRETRGRSQSLHQAKHSQERKWKKIL